MAAKALQRLESPVNKNLRTTIICFIVTLVLLAISVFVFHTDITTEGLLLAFGAVELAYIIYLVATGKGRS